MSEPDTLSLTNCDREPIHVPGSIQPHGCLLACDVSANRIIRHSMNSSALLGVETDLIGQNIETVLGSEAAHSVRNALARTQDGGRSTLLFGQLTTSGRRFDIAVHRFKGAVIIELEPAESAVAGPLELARSMIGRVTAIESIARLVRDTSRLINAMLGYDRVMVYKFGPDGSGKVVSETKRGDLESFLGQYFPASDIPQQARALYLLNTIRIISDANFERIPVYPVLDASGEPLDLSFAHLRAVSPIHCEYLRNMGVGASMSISIIVDGKLWGLIACHHYSPRTLTMAERVAAEMFGEFFSLHLAALQHKTRLDAASTTRDALARFTRDAVASEDIGETLRSHLADFLKLIPADGVGIWLDGTWTAQGSAPPKGFAPSLTQFAAKVSDGSIWATHHLSSNLAEAESFADVAAGVMVVPLSQRPRDYLFFFRKEVVQTLDWAGNPDKTYQTGPFGERLTPRKSFAIWKQTVTLQSEPWTDEDREFAEATRAALVEVVLQHSELLSDERAKAEVRQRMLNEELNHRVKNILAVIKSLVTHHNSQGESLEGYVEALRGRIQALSFAHDQVIRGDGGGSLRDLVEAEILPYRTEANRIDLSGPSVWLDARAFSVMALILHEMSTNAAKYGALSATRGSLLIRWQVSPVGDCILDWVETDGPPVRPPSRQGFGTVLIDRSIPFDLGGDSDVTFAPEGVRAHFRLPARFVTVKNDKPIAPQKRQTLATVADTDLDLSALHILIVEDQMLIAMDLEATLLDAGANSITTSSSQSDGLLQIEVKKPGVAILDVNLGTDTSLPIAEVLLSLGVPFIFATGYGEGGIIPPHLSAVPVVKKPYDSTAILAKVRAALHKD